MVKTFQLLLVTASLFSCMEASDNSNRSNKPAREETNQRPSLNARMSAIQKSQLNRTRGQKQFTHEQLNKEIVAGSLDIKEYRIIPDPQIDNTSEIRSALKPTKDCGFKSDLTSIEARRKNCLAENEDRSFWSGETNGTNGEGDWYLIYKKGNHLIWLDENTGLIWSHALKPANWNEASGFDVEESNFVCGLLDVLPTDQVRWRLPNRNEYLQAELDGARGVMLDGESFFWSATTAQDTSEAWAVNVSTGELKRFEKNINLDVKCIGEVLK